jgi:AAA domain
MSVHAVKLAEEVLSQVQQDSGTRPPGWRIKTSAEFIKDFIPPDPLIDGLLNRGYVYALTGHTGRGKTVIALLLAALVALARKLGELEVERGRVLVLAGENPTDVHMRWIAMAQQMDFDGDNIDVYFLDEVFPIGKDMQCLRSNVENVGGVDFVVVDSSAAYFLTEFDDENSNTQQGTHAKQIRELTKLKGTPCVLVLCHPTKNASDDSLDPRGGYAFVCEMDGNLTVTLDGQVATMHWQRKLRGPDFAPLNFLLRTVTHEQLKSRTGKLLTTVVASVLSSQEQETRRQAERTDETLLLQALKPFERGVTQAELTRLLGWTTKTGHPNRQKVSRITKRMKKDKYIDVRRDLVVLTDKGRKEIMEKPG